ncbi:MULTISPECIES: 30S ribosomal protein S12 methylthiotransferase accessory factor YcaO [unclassified Motilimonas]|uniref:30S ribosomal protein S12 methylthiotransferase accessory factor YcaO n=1 Tax=unclassified Motilimonas TaxID=2643697 RepID=UPI001E486E94|nr:MULTISPECIES: 30S ribosomal protein S12 methylthiotransferase accessory factor YcaO [unclassified Motilimonas]MCE0556832.1 YcaO-like family protein [Motilimonas sp. E26]MDO6525118.1 30S ribosomal protein S12 methylthiotransferase accessory factor YcaO [Motilimonas sp. 1_MG-2023]
MSRIETNSALTFITGKDAALEDSIETMQTKLKSIGFDIEEASWLNPVPNVWSVHIRDKDCPLCFTNGKGASKKAALASALGEFFERLSCNYFWADFYLGKKNSQSDFVHYPNEKWFSLTDDNSLPTGILDDYLHQHYNPHNELTARHLVDFNSGNDKRGICALPFTRQDNQETVYIPMNIVANLYVSNGMSAGNTRTEARVQALSELFERSVKNKIIADGISLPEIPAKVIASYPGIKASIDKLEAEGFPIYSYDASLGGKYPVICVVLLNPTNGTCFASFGAHPKFEVAFERTVTELLQGRSLKDLDVFYPPTFDNDDVADHHNLETHFIDSAGLISWDLFKKKADYEFVHWNSEGSSPDEFDALIAAFDEIKQPVYIADYEHLNVYSCRILAPGLSEIYPVEDLVWRNNSGGNKLRKLMFKLSKNWFDQKQASKVLDYLDAQDYSEQERVFELIGLAFEAGNPWKTLRVGELRCLLSLTLCELEEAQEWAQWTLDYGQSTLSPARMRFYDCLSQALQLELDENRKRKQYIKVFERMYSAELVQQVFDLIDLKQPNFGLSPINQKLEGHALHQKLLTAYDKLQQAKTTHATKQHKL